LEEGNLWDSKIFLTGPASKELEWWIENIHQIPPSSFLAPEAVLTIETDASLTGWGAVCNGNTTSGPWSTEDVKECPHINSLELKAAFLAVKSFARQFQGVVKIRMDNKPAVAYINKLGGRKSYNLNAVALATYGRSPSIFSES